MKKYFAYFVKRTETENKVEGVEEVKTEVTYQLTPEGRAIGSFVVNTMAVLMMALFAIYFVGIAAQSAAIIFGTLVMFGYFSDAWASLKVLLASYKANNTEVTEPTDEVAATA